LLIASFAVLALVLAFALLRPQGWTEAVAAVPAAALLIAIGAMPMRDAIDEVTRLLPVVGFLAAVLALAHFCDEEGVFRAAGHYTLAGFAVTSLIGAAPAWARARVPSCWRCADSRGAAARCADLCRR
jgi:Na+/H+ antiporter NhaD/arsenite permease-like protein